LSIGNTANLESGSLALKTLISILLLAVCRQAVAETAVAFPVGSVIPSVTCLADPRQSYALYLPSNFTTSRTWPIIYVFDPFGRGEAATKVVQAAAEKFGYIVAASNNSKNGPMGGSHEAAEAMWRDTHQRLQIDLNRHYFAGLSGGARVATRLALSCQCAAGVIANAAGFPNGSAPPVNMKFAYFATVGDSDFNYAEFAQLRPKLDASGAHYLIRIFEGPHGWAPSGVWQEALEWMDVQAMAPATLPRDPPRIQAAFEAAMTRAKAFESKGDWLSAHREYEAVVRNFSGLIGVTAAQAKISELERSKGLKTAQKVEVAQLDLQERLEATASAQIAILQNGEMDVVAFSELRSSIADLKRQAAGADRDSLVKRRALSGLVVQAYQSGQNSMDHKDYTTALRYFELAAIGSASPTWAHYQRARVYAMTSDKKGMLSELRKCLAEGIHDPSALDSEEFQRYRDQPEFQAVAGEWKRKASP
jgi:hypothetical protein